MHRPRYRALAERLRAEIAAGRPPVGATLPTEGELAATHRVSRHTVREALRCLAELGLISRRQGSGTHVTAARPQASTYRQSLASLADLLQYAKATRLHLGPAEPVVARGRLARLIGSAVGRAWLRYAGLRCDAAGTPIGLTELYVDPEFRDIERHFGERPGAVYELIEEAFGVAVDEIRQEIDAVTLAPRQAAKLGLPAGRAALRIVRRYLAPHGRLLQAAVNLHPAERFSYVMRIRRETSR
ncbi:MAG: GntR family transcriptional regulator [Alphaproteobacteria bacterium]|nr:GntR family transcriptional regulator [Alphaproteobacteria bacterium]